MDSPLVLGPRIFLTINVNICHRKQNQLFPRISFSPQSVSLPVMSTTLQFRLNTDTVESTTLGDFTSLCPFSRHVVTYYVFIYAVIIIIIIITAFLKLSFTDCFY